jgi:hypothetical protein
MTNLHGDGAGARVLEGRLLLLRAAALELAGVLDELVRMLAGASRGDTGWLRPLAVATAEVEFSVRHRFHVGASDVAAACAAGIGPPDGGAHRRRRLRGPLFARARNDADRRRASQAGDRRLSQPRSPVVVGMGAAVVAQRRPGE